VIDEKGLRPNVGMIIANRMKKVFIGKRLHHKSWQFPQGGVDNNETPIEALYRELYEEVGLKPQQIKIIDATPMWLPYYLPEKFIRKAKPTCVGQKQKWFLLELTGKISDINLRLSKKPEFDSWRWIEHTEPAKMVIDFKQEVYQNAFDYFKNYFES
jgi:putative (di)nucleoside polyphosphate hydrolase